MSFQQSQDTLEFIAQYNLLKREGVIATDRDFIGLVKWNASSLSQVLTGKRNIPRKILSTFLKIYQPKSDTQAIDDIKEARLQLLEDRISLLEKRLEYLISLYQSHNTKLNP